MATFGDIKSTISSNLTRDDLLDGSTMEALLEEHIRRAVRNYSVRNWWFLKTVSSSVTTTSGQNYVTRPATIERIQRVSIPSLGWELCARDLAALEEFDEPTAQSGQPQDYAEWGAKLRLWPVPNATFTLKIVGTEKIAEFSANADDTVWSNAGFDLIEATARSSFASEKMRDSEAAAAALVSITMAMRALQEQSVARADFTVKAGW